MELIIKHNDEEKNLNLGGKANSLLKLVHNNINVPKFFVITSTSYEEFLNANHINAGGEVENIKNKLATANIPENLEKQILSCWDEYNFKKVSVRSSASNEDGKTKSYAGQYETILNVEKDSLLESIKKCWASLYEDNVLAYDNDISSSSMNVIVQEMVDADYAGVAFSLDPTSNSKNYSVIELVKGLGDQLVSGSVTPSRLLVRRQTGRSDLCIGEHKLSEEITRELEQIVLNIETIYETPVDIEWCIKDDIIYILQARPITAFHALAIPYKKVISREKSIIETEIYYEGEYEGIKSLTRDLYYFKPLFIYDKDKGITNVYYNDMDLEEDPNSIYYYMQKDIDKTKKLYSEALKSVNYLNKIIDENNDEEFDYKSFVHNMVLIYPFTSLGNLAGYFENISDEVRELLVDFRNNYDYILYKADEYLLAKAKNILPENYKEHLKFLFLEEVFDNRLPSMDKIEARKNGYIYFNDKLELVEESEVWLKEHNISIPKAGNNNVVKGNAAYGGKTKGKVCQVFKKEDFKVFEEGNILVTTMTTPKFTPILNKAGAIVTDEGGITCHAAIIARELKIPCVIGCKNATEVLKTGMMVEVNADEGIINIISEN